MTPLTIVRRKAETEDTQPWTRFMDIFNDPEEIDLLVWLFSDRGLDRLRWLAKGEWRQTIENELVHRKMLKECDGIQEIPAHRETGE